MNLKLAAARDPLGRDLQVDYQRNFEVLGVVFRFETNATRVLEMCETVFFGSAKNRSGKPDFVIQLLEDPTFCEAPPWPKTVYRGRRHLFYLSIGSENTAVADLDRRLAIGFVSPGLIKDRGIFCRDFIECLAFTMATHGRGATHSYIHASAVVKENKGLIFSGFSGAGKSTLAYACAQRGFRIVADDAVYLKDQEDKLTAWGNPRRLRLASDSIELFPELRQRSEFINHLESMEVVEFDLEEILPGCAQPYCEPVALFFLNRSSGPTECRRLEANEALDLICRELISDSQDVMGMHRRAWTKLASKGSYMLRYGRDLDTVVGKIERFL